MCQSIGVFTNVNSEAKLLESLRALEQLKVTKVLLEEHIDAKLYRLIYFNGKLLEAICKEPANVTGDGAHSIQELIDASNRKREKIIPGHQFPTE